MNSNTVGNSPLSPQAPPSQHEGQQNGPQAADSGGPSASTDDGAKTAHAARWAALPAGLRERRQWVLVGHDKRPLTVSGGAASVTDPTTWTTFNEACTAAQTRGLGIGYVLHESDPFACIDLDVKDDTTPERLERFDKIVQVFDSYTERSRSGKGLHVWVEGKIGAGKRREGVEVYSQERFIICTGDVVRCQPIRERQQFLDVLAAEISRGTMPKVELEEIDDGVQDWFVAGQAFDDEGRFKTNELGRLFSGDWEGRYTSQSEADVTLVKMLGRYTESNAACWSAFLMSGLGKRDKALKESYRRNTLQAARGYLADEALAEARGKEIAEALFWRLSHDPSHFRLLTDRDSENLPPRWLVKGIIPEQSVGSIYGPSGTYKSFVALDLLAHVANGMSWFRHRTVAAPVVYIPFEGRGGISYRVQAWRVARSRGLPELVASNISYITEPMSLRRQDDRDKLVATLKGSDWRGLLCVDTLAHASEGIDENSSAMGEMIAIFNELVARLNCVVLVIHHMGKDAQKGMRGWSGVHAAMDFAIQCMPGPSRLSGKLTLAKVKDGESGSVLPFLMAPVHLGYDGDGDEYGSLTVVTPTESTPAEVIPPTDAARDAEDDEFLWAWVDEQVKAGRFPSKNSLKQQVGSMKANRPGITQTRVFGAIERLMACSRLSKAATKSPSGNEWIRAVDVSSGAAEG